MSCFPGDTTRSVPAATRPLALYWYVFFHSTCTTYSRTRAPCRKKAWPWSAITASTRGTEKAPTRTLQTKRTGTFWQPCARSTHTISTAKVTSPATLSSWGRTTKPWSPSSSHLFLIGDSAIIGALNTSLSWIFPRCLLVTLHCRHLYLLSVLQYIWVLTVPSFG